MGIILFTEANIFFSKHVENISAIGLGSDDMLEVDRRNVKAIDYLRERKGV